jgi:hypothetical protein
MKLKQSNPIIQKDLRAQLREWFVSCLSEDLEPVQIYEMLLSESKVCKDLARDHYEKTSEIHDFMIRNLSLDDPDFRDLRTPI